MNINAQMARILRHLKRYGKITPIQALDKFGSLRLGARIYDLRKLGYIIHTRLIERKGKRFAQYEFSKDQPAHLA